ncbi:hypothetical protein I6A84_19795 [Frankia sp. CNm7]|uniref:Uncharacterized protein n=1 Tax=Frankia nepalensis TaxID=1836974 RepID=A0A937RCY4_9ACTN|nr:hypothetical protein [Frankia nepalensis]MBL7496353.1 hypothetical protein [Frankia nepalensis]MBL7508450.1 hypothetical protein [Frankia nepalensis]MBL7520268.1 hypothetical protein [Frankia nepalensis]MBL7627582.1 hypothetical protein [Frankia nepalensis]
MARSAPPRRPGGLGRRHRRPDRPCHRDGSNFKTVADLPDSESAHAYALLGPSTGSTETGRIVWRTADEAVEAAEVRADVAGMLARVASLPGVRAIGSPYAADGSAQLDTGRNTAYATVTLFGR